MCGIIGYSSNEENAKNVVISSLKNLEYRGYDSAGIALSIGKEITLYKSKGKIANLEEKLMNKDIKSSTAIAHTRWATHGEPNEINAHPHKVGFVTLVHNGIIENYIDLKEFLSKENVEFVSSTDTEVACAYINYIYEKSNEKDNKIKILKEACNNFRGSFAFNVIFDDEPNIIYATRKDSPLVIGLSDKGNFAASDMSAILEYTNKYILLNHNEYAKIANNFVKVYNENLKLIQKEIKEATWSATEYKKNGYEHFMLKEINEQPKVIQDILNNYSKNNEYDDIDLNNYTNIHIVACGSAWHAGMIGKYLFENYTNIPVNVELASEYRYKNQLITPSTLVMVISQSGETADTLAALRIAKKHGAKVLAIVNAIGSTIAREADKTIYTNAGPEIAVATTKGYTSQVAILITLVLKLMSDKNLLTKEFKESLKNNIINIQNIMSDTINRMDEYVLIAENLQKSEHLFFLGRGIDYSLALEGSLKLKEISYIHSEAYAAGELKHGTISLIENGTKVIALCTDENLKEKTISNIKETKARGAFVLFITNDNNKNSNCSDFADVTLTIPKINDILQPLINIIPLQLIAYETAKLRGCDIDKPKNLAKSVTVE